MGYQDIPNITYDDEVVNVSQYGITKLKEVV